MGQAAAESARLRRHRRSGEQAGRRAASSGWRVLGFLNRNPLIASGMMKGIGGAICRRPDDNERSSAGATATTSPACSSPTTAAIVGGTSEPGESLQQRHLREGQYEYDPNSGRILPKAGG
jgi:hypothetical protein